MSQNKNFEEILKDGFNFIKTNKIFHIVLTAILFLAILIHSTDLRLNNVPILKDPTSGEYLMADLDALYFMRLAEVVLQNGNLDGVDSLRAPGLNTTYLQEGNPYAIVWLYKFLSIFGNTEGIKYAAVISPTVFYSLGLIIFFLLILYLTRSKFIAVLSSLLLAYNPSYLFRTMAGVADHDSFGMVALFASLLVFAYGLRNIATSRKKLILNGILMGAVTSFAMWTWAGAVTFIFLILPISIALFYLFGINNEERKDKENLLIYYLLWIVSYSILTILIGFSFHEILSKLLSPSGLLVPTTFGIIFVDYLLAHKLKFEKLSGKYRILYALLITLILGILALVISGKNIILLVQEIYIKLLSPFGGAGRLGLTVAENQQPYLVDWISQTGKTVFWLFYLGMIFISVEISKKIKSNLHKIGFVLTWIIAISSILFSRFSASSLILNGNTAISKTLYIGGFLLFLVYFAWLYFNDKFKIEPETAVLFSWMLIMVILGRTAARTIFVAAPFVCFAASFFIFKTWKYSRDSKDETHKMVLGFISLIGAILCLISLFGIPFVESSYGSFQAVSEQSKILGPSVNSQWQNAMEWVRENTGKEDIFVHWWDYGYFIQTIGQRPTVTDGGHAAGDAGDHNIGRYILTTPNPDTAMSFMRSWNVSYLLIDPTDLGKYGAYSRIGGDLNQDRYSTPTVLVSDSKQTVETKNGTRRVYVGTTFVDEDITYEGIFLPGPSYDKFENAVYKSYFLGATFEVAPHGDGFSLKQPVGVFMYNNKQYMIPIRYVFYNGEIKDYGFGIEATLRIVPAVAQTSDGQIAIDPLGAAIYLSPRTSESLLARLYLMDDPLNQYPLLQKAYFADDPVVQVLKANNINVGDIVYYQGLRSPLAIWKVNYNSNVKVYPDFVGNSLAKYQFGEMDKFFE